MSENPYEPPRSSSKSDLPRSTSETSESIEKAIYLNLRWHDNFFQAIFIFVSTIFSAITGAILAEYNLLWNSNWIGGAIIGTFSGLMLGTFASGIFLMFYRASPRIKREAE
ncbi:MAG: hypothetical protein Q8M16_15340 [Pirellulaceae bacterium]|nr:hypothetical protein [Pirellulaceae bacterium]